MINAPRLEVITGCMFSGKTEELIRRLERVVIGKGKEAVLLFKPVIDNRYSSNNVVTHYQREFPALILGNNGHETLANIVDLAGGEKSFEKANVIAFDEGNFFSMLLVSLCEDLVRLGKRVIVSGLDLTYAGEPFGPMPYLMAHADMVSKLNAVCVVCGGIATRTQRLVNGEPAPRTGETIIVGGDKPKDQNGQQIKYEARCRHCHVVP